MSLARQVAAIRSSVALSEPRGSIALRLSGRGARALLDRAVAADLTMRDGTMRHTLMLDEQGRPVLDCLVGLDGGSFLLLGEGQTVPELRAWLARVADLAGPGQVEIEDLRERHAWIGLHGPFAWELMAALEGPGVVGVRYLTFFRGLGERLVVRAGATGEYGFELLVPHARRDELVDGLLRLGARLELERVDDEALAHCAFESFFFDLERARRWPVADLTPVELQLQWRVSSSKPFVGAEAVRARLPSAHAPVEARRLVALCADEGLAAGTPLLAPGEADAPIGLVLETMRSLTLGKAIGVGLLDRPYAHAGLALRAPDGQPLRTVSAPFVDGRSSYVNPTRHAWETRAEIAFPDPDRTRQNA